MSINRPPLAPPRRVCYNRRHDLARNAGYEGFRVPSSVRLFWEDPYRTEFRAHVARLLTFDGRPAVVLDQTCFYPTSGGQPHDTGTLNGVEVLDVLEVDGDIVHLLAAPLEHAVVQGRIDWDRRQDHMQQHAGQHILSAAFEQVLEAQTQSFHLGSDDCTIDLDLSSLDERQASTVEDCANRAVLDDLPIRTRQFTADELSAVRLRKPPQVEGPVRVVSVGDLDHSACGGTHPNSAGQGGLIHIDRWERRHGGVRVDFLCGQRALRDYRGKNRICRDLAARQSVSIAELPAAIERMDALLSELRRAHATLRDRLLVLTAQSLQHRAVNAGRYRIIAQVLDEADAVELPALAQQLCREPGLIAILAIRQPRPQFCFARADDVDLNMNAVLRTVAAPHGGRGGGQPHLVQGGGLLAEDVDRMIQDALEYLSGDGCTAAEGERGQ